MLALGTRGSRAQSSCQRNVQTTSTSRGANVRSRRNPHPVAGPCGRSLIVAVFSKNDHSDSLESFEYINNASELQAYINRERFLLSELAAARGQVDKLLDQQRVLIDMISRLSGLAAPAAPQPQPQSLPHASQPLPQRPPAASPATTPAATPTASKPPRVAASTSGSTSSDVPAFTSLADLFTSAASSAPNPASAAAAASVAAAFAAVDAGDILAINNFDIPAAPAAPGKGPVSLPQPPLLFDTLGGFTRSSSSSSTPAATAAGAAAAEESADDLPVEVAKAAPTDPPPDLVQGDDDIFWLSKLHAGLEGKGFYPGDDDMENWFFGEGTLAAVLAFQATERLPETGVVDRPTWTALLGADVADELYDRARATAAADTVTEVTVAAVAEASRSGGDAVVAAAAAATIRVSSSSSSTPSEKEPSSRDVDAASPNPTKWPVLMEGDGGREVHALQVALCNSGYHCGEDDLRWWQFGDTTLTALKFFQSCSHLPESGVADERTWRALLGADARPADLYSLRLKAVASDEEDGGYEEDMDATSSGRVWLLGEQRWERRSGK